MISNRVFYDFHKRSPESVRHKIQNAHHILKFNSLCGVEANFQCLLTDCRKRVFLTIGVSSMATDRPWIFVVLQYCLY